MSKMIIHTMIIPMLLLNVLPCSAQKVALELHNLILDSSTLQFDFTVTNNTAKAIWVCEDMDDKSKIDYQVKTDENRRKVEIKFGNFIVPGHIYLEEPIWARFRKLPPKGSLSGNVRLKVPLHNVNPIKQEEESSNIRIGYVNDLTLQICVYEVDLEKLKTSCCRGDSDSQKAFVNCFWAEKNKGRIIKKEVRNLKIPIIAEETSRQ